MKSLTRLTLVQFYLYDQVDIDLSGHTALLGPNGCGKSSTLDAIQIVMMGANSSLMHFNTQSVSQKQTRSIRDYCLGVLRQKGDAEGVVKRARDEALSYLVLTFSDPKSNDVLSVGLCVSASVDSEKHTVEGMFIVPGQSISASDCVNAVGDGAFLPLPWDDFISERRQQARERGLLVLTPSTAGEFVQELLYQIGGKDKMPHPSRFMRAFVKAMTLKNVDSIDQFVRHHVVEANPINVATFGRQIRQFRDLQALIVTLKIRIARLTEVAGLYGKVTRAWTRAHTLTAITATLGYEDLVARLNLAHESIEEQREKKDSLEREQVTVQADLAQLTESLTDLSVALANDPVESRRRELAREKDYLTQLISTARSPMLSRVRAIRAALGRHEDALTQLGMRDLALGVRDAADVYAPPSTLGILADALPAMDSALASLRIALGTTRDQQRDQLGQEERTLDSLEGRLSAWTKSRTRVEDATGRLLHALEYKDIDARPLSAVVEVIDRDWQPAIEAYLGARRDALIVPAGRTREAVAVLRSLHRAGQGMQGASVIQHEQLRHVRIPHGERLLIQQLRTDDPVAMAYLRSVLGDMRCVDTEEELERVGRALTQDGLLSQGAVTRALAKVPPSDFRLGKQTGGDAEHLRDLAATTRKRITEARSRIAALDELIAVTTPLPSAGGAEDSLDLGGHEAALVRIETELHALNEQGDGALRQRFNETTSAHRAQSARLLGLAEDVGKAGERLSQAEMALGALQQQVILQADVERTARSHEAVDMGLYAQIKEKVEQEHATTAQRLSHVDTLKTRASEALDQGRQKARDACLDYVRQEEADAQVDAMSWQEESAWVNSEVRRLTDFQLVQREQEAADVRKTAEETFRSDVAISLHDRFVEMDRHRREFNRILGESPPFTGGERYEFAYSVLPERKALYDLIKQIARSDEDLGDLFRADQNEAQREIVALIDAAADPENGPKAPEALIDFRAFFSFDLNIKVDGKVVDRMSARQGAGSNGEHIAPMYVAAGASLAKAYRMPTRPEERVSTGIMLLDEAFHGMDTQNATATARFLQGLGLQLVMAGPELEKSKLLPLTDTIYDLDREGLDLELLRTHYTPLAHSLMVSDMPSENPQVFTDALAHVLASKPTNSGANAGSAAV